MVENIVSQIKIDGIIMIKNNMNNGLEIRSIRHHVMQAYSAISLCD